MSCGNPATETDALMTRKPKFDKSKTCVKCKEKTGNLVIRHAVYCKECFFPLVTAKFRKSLEPSVNEDPKALRKNPMRASGNLLVGLSGGLGSTVLLDLVSRCYFTAQDEPERGGKDHPQRNVAVWKKAAVVYVNLCAAYPGTRDRTEEVRAVVAGYKGFEFIPLRLEDAFDPEWWGRVGGNPGDTQAGVSIADQELTLSSPSSASTPLQSLTAYLQSLPTQTALPATIQTLTRILLLHTARETESSHLVLGTSLTSLSISLISSIAQGGGFVVREEAQEEWTSSDKFAVRINRPLKDVGMKECAAWAWWAQLPVVGKGRSAGSRQAIGGLTKDFIVGLERDFPSTVSTIARTCGKLAPKTVADGVCVLCEKPVQQGVQDWKTRISIRSYTSPNTGTNAHPPPHVQAQLTAPIGETTDSPSLTPHLCYACHTTLTSRSSRGAAGIQGGSEGIALPVWVGAKLNQEGELWKGKKMGEKDMRSSIGEFLL